MSYKRKLEEKRRYKKLDKSTDHYYPSVVYYNKEKGYYERIWKSDGKHSLYAIYKRIARRSSRRYAKKLVDIIKMYQIYGGMYINCAPIRKIIY